MKNFLTLLLPVLLFGEIYFLPYEKEKALQEILSKIKSAKYSIQGAIYSFTHKKIADEIKKAAKRGVKVELIFDKNYNMKRFEKSMLFYLAKYKNIDIYLLSGKPYKRFNKKGIMHIKAIIIDNKYTLFGSANWTYGAFDNNYEILYSIKDYQIAKKFKKYLNYMKSQSKKFK